MKKHVRVSIKVTKDGFDAFAQMVPISGPREFIDGEVDFDAWTDEMIVDEVKKAIRSSFEGMK